MFNGRYRIKKDCGNESLLYTFSYFAKRKFKQFTMKRIYFIISLSLNIILLLYLGFLLHSRNDNTMNNDTIRIVMLGNSITHAGNWSGLLQRNDIFNGGMPGWTSEQLSWVIKDYIVPKKPLICFYMAGINDYSLGITTERIERNNKMILDSIHECGTTPIYQTLLYQLANDSINREIDKLNKQMKAFCSSRNYEFLDLRPYLCKDGNLREEFTYDGTHLTDDAYIPWAEAIQPLLKKYGL